MNPFSLEQPRGTRREFLHSVSALALVQTVKPAIPSALRLSELPIPPSRFVPVKPGKAVKDRRSQQRSSSICANPLVVMGARRAFSQLVSTDEDYLKRLRRAVEDKGMFLELSLGGKLWLMPRNSHASPRSRGSWALPERVWLSTGDGTKNSQTCKSGKNSRIIGGRCCFKLNRCSSSINWPSELKITKSGWWMNWLRC